MIATQERRAERLSMYSANKLKLGFFGPNCSSGRFVTKAPERWSGNWEDNVRLAQMGDDAGMDFLLPIGRWKGHGGETDYQGTTWETITWATGLLALTKRITIFGTVHATLFPPLIAAKQMVTADHVGHGRFGLNLVCGSNEGEFEMFGVSPGDHARRYRQGQEWLDAIKLVWEQDDFDYKGEFFELKGVREKPKPYGGTRPMIMNAGASGEGRAFALRNSDAWFTSVRRETLAQASLEDASRVVNDAKADARASGNEIGAFCVAIVICKPTHKEAQEYHRYVSTEMADWGAVDDIVYHRNIAHLTPEQIESLRRDTANGKGGLLLIDDPDGVAKYLAKISDAGFEGCGMSFVNYADEFPFFRQEVLARLADWGYRV